MAARKPRVFKSELLEQLDRKHIDEALGFARKSPSANDFYRLVGMTRPSWSYFVKDGSGQHSLKAIVTASCRTIDPSFKSTNFNAAYGAKTLRRLGYEVIHLTAAEKIEFKRVERQRVEASRLARPDQIKFRVRLIQAYNGRCPITNCSTPDVLDAAHVRGITNDGGDETANGILLRSDLHRLFDRNLMAVDPVSGAVRFSKSCRQDYADFDGRVIALPKAGPSLKAFDERWVEFAKT